LGEDFRAAVCARRFEAGPDFLAAKPLVFRRVDAEIPFPARFFRVRRFSPLLVTASKKAATALFAVSIAASTFALAASAMASCAEGLNRFLF
jgi:hypothetical protein